MARITYFVRGPFARTLPRRRRGSARVFFPETRSCWSANASPSPFSRVRTCGFSPSTNHRTSVCTSNSHVSLSFSFPLFPTKAECQPRCVNSESHRGSLAGIVNTSDPRSDAIFRRYSQRSRRLIRVSYYTKDGCRGRYTMRI